MREYGYASSQILGPRAGAFLRCPAGISDLDTVFIASEVERLVQACQVVVDGLVCWEEAVVSGGLSLLSGLACAATAASAGETLVTCAVLSPSSRGSAFLGCAGGHLKTRQVGSTKRQFGLSHTAIDERSTDGQCLLDPAELKQARQESRIVLDGLLHLVQIVQSLVCNV